MKWLRLRLGILFISLAVLIAVPGISAQGLPSPTILDVSWSPDSSKLAIAGTEGLSVVNIANGETLPGFDTSAAPIYTVAWSPDSSQLASSGEDKLINIWNANNGMLYTTLSSPDFSELAYMSWSPDGTKLARVATAVDINTLQIWDMVQFELITELNAGPIAEMIWLEDNNHLLLVTTTRGVLKLSLSSLPVAGSNLMPYHIGPDEPSGAIALKPNGTTLAIGSFYEPIIYLWDIVNNQQLDKLEGHTDFVTAMDWHPSANILASVALDGTLKMWDTTSGNNISTTDMEVKFYTLDWSPDGTHLAYGGETPDGQSETLIIGEVPVADAGEDQTIFIGPSPQGRIGPSANVTLDGTGSSDPDGTITSYDWYQNGVLLGSGPTLTRRFFVGQTTVTLVVTDNDGLTSSDEVIITVTQIQS
ncbi:MAG: hypothetical protein L0154_03840 [Chloroflexi bacterium]|nr:hypothetical protein [Chloroflexota bacterium]